MHTVMKVVMSATTRLFSMEYASAGVVKYSAKLARPMKFPSWSSTLFESMVHSGMASATTRKAPMSTMTERITQSSLDSRIRGGVAALTAAVLSATLHPARIDANAIAGKPDLQRLPCLETRSDEPG